MKKLYLILFAVTLFFGFSATTAHAQGYNLSISPSNLQIQTTGIPSDITAPFTIKNLGSEPVTLSIILKRFRTLSESGELQYSNPQLTQDSRDQFLQTVQIFDNETVTNEIALGPQQEKELILAIPQQLTLDSNQDHYFAIVFLTKAETTTQPAENESTIAKIQAGISLPVLLALGENKAQVGFIEEFSTSMLKHEGPTTFTVRLNNKGNHFINTKSVLTIKNMFGQIVGQINLPKTAILANSTRKLSSADELGSGKINWGEKFLLGFYTVTLTLTTSPDKSLYTQSIYFFAFPLLGIISLIIGITIAGLVFHGVRRKLKEE